MPSIESNGFDGNQKEKSKLETLKLQIPYSKLTNAHVQENLNYAHIVSMVSSMGYNVNKHPNR